MTKGLILICLLALSLSAPALAAGADNTSQIPVAAAANAVASPYSLTLSLETESYMVSKDDKVPRVNMFVNNASKHTLDFPYDRSDVLTVKVEYKPLTDKPLSSEHWTSINPAFRSNVGFAMHMWIPAGQQQELHVALAGCAMSNLGYYRLTATFTPPRASTYDGKPTPTTNFQYFNLSLSSKPLLIRHDENGFSNYPPVDSGTPIPPSRNT